MRVLYKSSSLLGRGKYFRHIRSRLVDEASANTMGFSLRACEEVI